MAPYSSSDVIQISGSPSGLPIWFLKNTIFTPCMCSRACVTTSDRVCGTNTFSSAATVKISAVKRVLTTCFYINLGSRASEEFPKQFVLNVVSPLLLRRSCSVPSVIYNYEPGGEQELCLQVGDTVHILEKLEGEWAEQAPTRPSSSGSGASWHRSFSAMLN